MLFYKELFKYLGVLVSMDILIEIVHYFLNQKSIQMEEIIDGSVSAP